jgi:hypothetical protein
LENHWKIIGKSLENHWKIIGKSLEKGSLFNIHNDTIVAFGSQGLQIASIIQQS